MQQDCQTVAGNRALTDAEMRLARWMLEHGTAAAIDLLPQLERAEVTSWRCPCGCASINFQIKGSPVAPPGVNVLGDFLFSDGDNVDNENVSGVFIYESGGILSGLEVTGYSGDPPKSLPTPELLRPFSIPTVK